MRPDRLNPLFADVTSLAGVGPALARQLERLGITRVRDLLFHLPVGVRETSVVGTLADAVAGGRIAIEVRVEGHEPPRGRAPAKAVCADAAGERLDLAFFGPQAARLAASFRPGQPVWVAGRIETFSGRWQMVHPERPGRLQPGQTLAEPLYPLTEGLTHRRLATLAEAALQTLPALPEWSETALLAARGWPGFGDALARAHADPRDAGARDRLAHDELMAGQLGWALVRARTRARRTLPLPGTGRLTSDLLARLPFTPTGAQQRVSAEIAADMGAPRAMLRLLQGDVGSGKTLVALLAMLRAVESGAQAALLAPTELLARQHEATLATLLEGLPVRSAFLSGREKGRAREAVLDPLAAGETDMLVGTHAIFQQAVAYRRLGLAVIDEQHRFGVAQRLMLAEKGETPPHLLVMTATPIPRTLALASYGEMDVSKLDERPPGRQPVDTRIVSIARLGEVLDGVARHLAEGRRAYWVCPHVEAPEGAEQGPFFAATERAGALKARFGDLVELVHGRMAGPAKDRAMARFQAGEARLLVATTVIEVGVDVPEATLMIVEGAERFGLAQLHQLRGRVGRGADRSVCLLLRGERIGETARDRLAMMRATDDGFAIAEADLRLRGMGELLGTRQSGGLDLRLADDAQVGRLIEGAQADARLLVERDGGLAGSRGEAARLLLYLFEKDAAVSTLRSG
jgi:ATP-dependent DNA helicase RecG